MSLCTKLIITFNILNDDKEHQDAVAVRVIDKQGRKLFEREIVPSTGDDGNGDYFWHSPQDGDAHPHPYELVLTQSVPIELLVGGRLDVWSNNGDGSHGDFESWNASVSLSAILDNNQNVPLTLNAGNAVMGWGNSTDNNLMHSATISTILPSGSHSERFDSLSKISANLLDANGEIKKSGILAYRGSNKTENGLELFFLLDENRELAFAPDDIIESGGKKFYIKGMFLNCSIAMGNHHHIEAGDAKTMFVEDFLNSGDETGKFPYTIVARFPKHGFPEIVIALYTDEDSASQTFRRLDPDEARMRERRATTAQYVLVYRGQDLNIRDIEL